jgi:hypothetical protein
MVKKKRGNEASDGDRGFSASSSSCQPEHSQRSTSAEAAAQAARAIMPPPPPPPPKKISRTKPKSSLEGLSPLPPPTQFKRARGKNNPRSLPNPKVILSPAQRREGQVKTNAPVTESGELLIKWNGHSCTINKLMLKTFVESQPTDCTLLTRGNKILCHQVFIACSSRLFDRIIDDFRAEYSQPQRPELFIALNQIPIDNLQGVLNFIYEGEITGTSRALTSTLETVQILQINGFGQCANGTSAPVPIFTLPEEATKLRTCPFFITKRHFMRRVITKTVDMSEVLKQSKGRKKSPHEVPSPPSVETVEYSVHFPVITPGGDEKDSSVPSESPGKKIKN